MEAGNQIQYLSHKEINKTKWDACILNAPNGLIYPYSFYLDHMAKNWDALVFGDYEAVMPLTWNKKYSFLLFIPTCIHCITGCIWEKSHGNVSW